MLIVDPCVNQARPTRHDVSAICWRVAGVKGNEVPPRRARAAATLTVKGTGRTRSLQMTIAFGGLEVQRSNGLGAGAKGPRASAGTASSWALTGSATRSWRMT